MKTRIITLSASGSRIRLPVNPEKVEFTEKQLNQTQTLLNVGEVNFVGGRGLRTVKLSSFFPSSRSPFYRYARRAPKYYLKKITQWKRSGSKVRVIVPDLRINLMMLIDELSYTVSEGDRDVYYTISLSEYRQLNVLPVQMPLQLRTNGLQERPNAAKEQAKEQGAQPASRTIVKGDTLWGIAKSQYGSGNLYTKIYDANKDVIEAAAKAHGKANSGGGNWIYAGTVLTIPA